MYNTTNYAKLAEITDLDVVKYLHEQHYLTNPISSFMSVFAACNNQLDILKYFKEHNLELNWQVTYIAVRYGYIDMLDTFYDPINSYSLFKEAIIYNRRDVIDYLINKGYKLDEEDSVCAATHERYELMDYFLTLNIPLSTDVIKLVALHNNKEYIDKLLAYNCPIDTTAIWYAALGKHIDMIEYLIDKCPRNGCSFPIDVVAYIGDIKLIKKMMDYGYVITSRTLSYALDQQHDELIVFLLKQDIKIEENAVIFATNLKRLDYLKLITPKTHFDTDTQYRIIENAAQHSDLNILEYLTQVYEYEKAKLVNINNIHIFKYLNDKGIEPRSLDISSLILNYNYDILEYVLQRYHKLTYNIYIDAVTVLDARFMKLAFDYNLTMHTELLNDAIMYENIDAIEFLLSKGVVPDYCAMSDAIDSGHVYIVKLLYDNGTKLTDKHIIQVIDNGDIDMLKYIYSLNIQLTSDMLDIAATYDLVIVSYLISIGTPISDQAITNAAKYGKLSIIEYLYEHNAPISNSAIEEAANNGHLDVIRYLHQLQVPITNVAIKNAVNRNHIHIVKYLYYSGVPIFTTDDDIHNYLQLNHIS